MAVATFGGGCFWGVEYFFRQVPGVLNATSGYMGGDDRIKRYEEVKQGNSGHAEVVQVEFDEAQVSFTELLQVFWSNHNPTSLNRQGGDIGTQYRSVIFFHSKEQKEQAEASKLALARSGKWGQRHIVTEIVPVKQFHRAEEYHQDYIQKNNLPSCHLEY
ncbi:peptide-methionine (S)-S-oxide reductase MsrA [Shewanella algae]|uniref:peptide-methionine (S)-S-oxide reductase MsrA n=1 Tax=Shewanella algae TaxID=38313 RepID=UPI0005CD5046|nr:peptide-methionine (S)-S-oxide reductase MsrA [Shewanella algae]EKT4486631.1 peptide-methionine (S)-S-oxide reductase MsrA [Shewanella algae]MBO2547896.1 peptide-methionine (S)-S-oxide reductase MsrA [Shewanella algae]MBO2569548.1 peptide-methionine (S)-S-oxide reductase MsrA [Shewanella algae]MBO2582406.1 peptide-methionine (S)-S-oxide reductase MsrA [Shewanella algae]MBO2600824.1 peptide-methionine (S)-S-oxide reductase MsrA [Shewanella algae]